MTPTPEDRRAALAAFMNDPNRPRHYYPGERLLDMLAESEMRARLMREEVWGHQRGTTSTVTARDPIASSPSGSVKLPELTDYECSIAMRSEIDMSTTETE